MNSTKTTFLISFLELSKMLFIFAQEFNRNKFLK